MQDAKARRLPTLFIRFEDLVRDPEAEHRKMMKFLLGERDLSGTNAERRILEVIAKGAKASETYELKDTTKKFNQNAGIYTEVQRELFKNEFKEYLHFFGYAKLP